MALTSFEMNEETLKAIEELKRFYGVKTNAAVLKRALALAMVAAENADERKQLTILDRSKPGEAKEKIVVMAGGV